MMFKHSFKCAKDANLTSDVKLVSLLGVISKMESETSATQNQEVVLVIGSTGAGKSTFINYVAGREMGVDTSQMDDAVICKNALAPIGHGMKSCTDRPQLYKEPKSGLILSDCPGFFDNRGIDVEIANAVGIQSMAKNSKHVKGIVLIIERSSFTSSRGQGLEMALKSTLEFLGPELSNNLDSIMLLISKVPNNKVAITYKTIAEESERFPLCAELLRMGNVGFYSPLDDLRPAQGVLTRRDLLGKIQGLKGIANSERTFNITVSPSAKLELTGLVSLISTRIRNHLAKQEFDPLPQLLKLIDTLLHLRIDRVDDEAQKMESMVIDQIKLLEFQDKAVDQLNQLKKHMPPPYQPVIEQTMQRLQQRLAKEQQIAAESKKTQVELSQSKMAIVSLQNQQGELKQSLKDAKISKQEFEKQNVLLQEQIEKAKNDNKGIERHMQSLQSELTAAKAEALQTREMMTAQLDQAEKKAEERVNRLQTELENQRQVVPNIQHVFLVPRYPGFGGMMPHPFCRP